jgi:hypothetical protein
MAKACRRSGLTLTSPTELCPATMRRTPQPTLSARNLPRRVGPVNVRRALRRPRKPQCQKGDRRWPLMLLKRHAVSGPFCMASANPDGMPRPRCSSPCTGELISTICAGSATCSALPSPTWPTHASRKASPSSGEASSATGLTPSHCLAHCSADALEQIIARHAGLRHERIDLVRSEGAGQIVRRYRLVRSGANPRVGGVAMATLLKLFE